MWKLAAILILITVVGGYFWYVQGVDFVPLVRKAASFRISVTFDEPEMPVPEGQDPARGIWAALPGMPKARTEVAVAALGKDVFVIGGLDGLGRTVDAVDAYDTESKTWRSENPLPVKAHHVSAVVIGGELYVFGGFSGLNFEPLDQLWRLDRGAKQWQELAVMPAHLGAMGAAGYVTSAGKAKIYAFGGAGTDGVSRKTFEYDIERDEWAARREVPTAREHLAAAAIGDKIYVVGGRVKTVTKNRDELEIYIPEKDIWAIGAPMPTSRGGIAAAAAGGKLYVFGGEQPVATFEEVEEYDPAKKEWQEMNPMPTSRHGLGAAEVDGIIYVIGGGKRPLLSVSKTNEAFTPPEEPGEMAPTGGLKVLDPGGGSE